MAEPTPDTAKTRSKHEAHRRAYQRVQSTSDEIKASEAEHRKRRERIAQEQLELTAAEKEAVDRCRNIQPDDKREQDRACANHYLEWLNSQNILDCMREEDLRATGRTQIVLREGRGEYPRYGRDSIVNPEGDEGQDCPAGNPGGGTPPSTSDGTNDLRSQRSQHSSRREDS